MLSGPPVTSTARADQLLERFLSGSPRQRRSLVESIEQRRDDLLPLIPDQLDRLDATGDDWAAGLLVQLLLLAAGPASEGEAGEGEAFLARYPDGWLAVSSAAGLDYAPLQRHLMLQQFEDADRLTSTMLRQLAGSGAEQRGYVFFSEVAAILCFISALGHMPIADVTAIAQIAPLVVLLGMWLFFGERVGGLRLGLAGLGITGALLVAQPGGETASPFAILGFFTAVGAAGRDILSRKVPARTPALVVTFSTLLIVMLGAVLMSILFETQVQPTFRHGWLMFIAGFFLMCGHALVFMAYRVAPARVVAPFNYSFMIWAGLSGLLVFGDVPNGLALAGMGLILAAGLAVVLLEGRTRQGETVPVKG